ncbi:hypothetical protein [Virgibacillus salexigens]|uniref:Uncharacterized protein n=1 Tax=Virgibacillus kapii TaxID=1638645 RepID=A0ABQ2DGL6_9BACI|nr:hypothetical protein [Virgibacillus kapii]GGJ57338.1 hypothetical protein GCM10007111_19390 [Virgibacillus kapii]
MNKKTNLTVIAYEKPLQEKMNYKYLIKSSGFQSYTAYKTDKGFQFFLESRNLQLKLVDEIYNENTGMTRIYNVIGEVQEESFWHIKDIPQEAIAYKDLSNGSIVACYYLHNINGATIYRPNPNAKEVYDPMPLDDTWNFNE